MKENFLNYKKTVKEKICEYISNNEDKQIIKDIKLKILDLIFKNIKEENNFKNNKIYFDMNLWITLYKHELFKKNALMIHNLVNKLKSKSFVLKSSRNYPKNQFLFSTNPLNPYYLRCKLKDYDRIIGIRDDLMEKIINFSLTNKEKNIQFEICLFIFFKLFSIVKIPNSYFKCLKKENIIYVGNKVIFIIKEEVENGFIPLFSIILDDFTSNIIKKVFPQHISTIFDANEYIFSNEFNFYNSELRKFCNENLIYLGDANNAVSFEYQLKNSSLALTLIKNQKHPKLSLFELEKLYPKSVSASNQELLNIERKNLEIYRNINQDDKGIDFNDDIDDELDLETELKFKFQIYEKLREIKEVPLKTELMSSYCKKWYCFLEKEENQADRFTPIYNHIRYFFNDYENKNINKKTLQSYLQSCFDYCFDILIKSVNIEEALKEIHRKLKNSKLNPNVQKKYQSRIMLFFNREFSLGFDKIKSVINYNRSIIFPDELNKVINKLIYADKEKYHALKYSRAVYVILAYYTGLRKAELYSRLSIDLRYIGNNKFQISVNRKGINLINKKEGKKIVSLKNSNAKRAFEFEITNSSYLKKVLNYIDELKKNEIRFLFPDANKNNTMSKYRVTRMSNIDKINNILQKTTKRYTVLHSFRHTYVTNEIIRILTNSDKRIEDMYDLIFRVGHGDPETTISIYTHLDLYFLQK